MLTLTYIREVNQSKLRSMYLAQRENLFIQLRVSPRIARDSILLLYWLRNLFMKELAQM